MSDPCITCGDVAVAATVLTVDGTEATVEIEGRQEGVNVELVGGVEAGDVILCHAGIALQRLEATK